MADGPTAIPDRVVDVVAARIGVQRQRRAWPFPRRTNVTTQIKLIAALAAVLVVAVVGYSLLPGTTGPGGPTTAPTPSAQPRRRPRHRAPSAGAVFPAWWTSDRLPRDGAGILQPAATRPVLQAGLHLQRPRRAGSTTVTGGLLQPVPGHARQPGRVRALRGHRPIHRHGAAYQPVVLLRVARGQSGRDGGRDGRRHGGQRSPRDDRAGRRRRSVA